MSHFLAEPDDVRRWLGEAVDDPTILPLLEAADEWVRDAYRRDWGVTGSVTESFPSAHAGDVLLLKEPNPSSITVTVYERPDSPGRALSAAEFEVAGGGRVRLRHDPFRLRSPLSAVGPTSWPQPGLYDALRAADAPAPAAFSKVEVAYTASGVVPTPVREAVALIVAATYRRGRAEVSGMQSERLGDYSYTRETTKNGATVLVPKMAQDYLAPYGRGPQKVAAGALVL